MQGRAIGPEKAQHVLADVAVDIDLMWTLAAEHHLAACRFRCLTKNDFVVGIRAVSELTQVVETDRLMFRLRKNLIDFWIVAEIAQDPEVDTQCRNSLKRIAMPPEALYQGRISAST